MVRASAFLRRSWRLAMTGDVRPPARLPLLILGMLALVWGVMGGLARVGVGVPDVALAQAGMHGALMIPAFFGTVISLERAVALGQRWAYLAPACAGAGGVAVLLGAPQGVAQGLFVLSAFTLTLASLTIMRRQVALFTAMLAVGALCAFIGNAVWLAAGALHDAVPWWLAFLVLTIAGERLELTRLLPRKPAATPAFLAAVAVVLGGVAGTLWAAEGGLRVFGAGLLALSGWLLIYDIARRNARQRGIARFIAICLLSGYAWLAIGGLFGLGGGFAPGHAQHDAAVHAIALGFVFAMVFGHAPIIFPAILRVRVPYHPAFYLPLIVLHASLALRVGGGVAETFALRQYGASANALALLLFIVIAIASVVRGQARRA